MSDSEYLNLSLVVSTLAWREMFPPAGPNFLFYPLTRALSHRESLLPGVVCDNA
jgi:hypothetical protein